MADEDFLAKPVPAPVLPREAGGFEPAPIQPKPDFVDVVGASFTAENEIGALIDHVRRQKDFEPVPGYTPFEDDNLRGTRYIDDHGERFIGVRSPSEAYAVKQKIDREDESHRLREAAGWTGTLTDVAAGLLSPTNLLPAGVVYRAARMGERAVRSAASVGAANAAGAVIQEGALHATQVTRTAGESGVSVAGAAILGAAVGTAAGMFAPRTITRLAGELAGEIPAREHFSLATGGRGQSVGAAAAEDADTTLKQGWGGATVSKVFQWLTPLQRMQNSESEAARLATAKLADPGGITLKAHTAEGGNLAVVPGGSVEIRVKMQQESIMARFHEAYDQVYQEYWKAVSGSEGIAGKIGQTVNAAKRAISESASGPMSPSEFAQAVGRAERTDGAKSADPFIQRAAEVYRKHIAEVQQVAVDAGVIDAPLTKDPKFAGGYVPRIYLSKAIAAKAGEFTDLAFRSMKADQERKALLQGQAATASGELEAMTRAEKKALGRRGTIQRQAADAEARIAEVGMAAKRGQTRHEAAMARVFDMNTEITELEGTLSGARESKTHAKAYLDKMEKELGVLRRARDKALAAAEKEPKEVAADTRVPKDALPASLNPKRVVDYVVGERSEPRVPKALGFVQWVIDQGGVKETGGDVRAMAGGKAPKGLIREDGLSLDELAKRYGEKIGEETYLDGAPGYRFEDEIGGYLEDAIGGKNPDGWEKTFPPEVRARIDEYEMGQGIRSSMEEQGLNPDNRAEVIAFLRGEDPSALPGKTAGPQGSTPVNPVQDAIEAEFSAGKRVAAGDVGLVDIPAGKSGAKPAYIIAPDGKIIEIEDHLGFMERVADRAGVDLDAADRLLAENGYAQATLYVDKDGPKSIAVGFAASGVSQQQIAAAKSIEASLIKRGMGRTEALYERLTGYGEGGGYESLDALSRDAVRHEKPTAEAPRMSNEEWEGLLNDPIANFRAPDERVAADKADLKAIGKDIDRLRAKIRAREKVEARQMGGRDEAAVNARASRSRLDVLLDRAERIGAKDSAIAKELDDLTKAKETTRAKLEEIVMSWQGDTTKAAQAALARRAEYDTTRQIRNAATDGGKQGFPVGRFADEMRASPDGELLTRARNEVTTGEPFTPGNARLASADGEVDLAIKRILRSDRQKTDAELLTQAREFQNNMVSNPEGRLAYEWGETATKEARGALASRGATGDPNIKFLKERRVPIEDKDMLDFTENDIRAVFHAYTHSMIPQAEMARMFDGDVSASAAIRAIKEEYAGLIANLPTVDKDGVAIPARKLEKQRERLTKNMNDDIKDFAAMRDRILGTYAIPADPDSLFHRAGSVARQFNFLSKMGMMVVSSAAEVMMPVIRHGLGNAGEAWVQGLNSFSKGADEVRVSKAQRAILTDAGVAVDMIIGNKAMSFSEIGSDFGRRSKFERGLSAATGVYSYVNLSKQWDTAMQTVAGVATLQRMMRGIESWATQGATKDAEFLAAHNIGENQARRIWAAAQAGEGERVKGAFMPEGRTWADKEAYEMLRVGLRQAVDSVQLKPGTGQDKPLWMSTPTGAVIGQFRSFIISSQQRIVIAGLQQADASVVQGAIGALALGTLSVVLSDLARDGVLKERSPAEWFADGFDRSGIGGAAMEANNIAEKLSGQNFGLRPLAGAEPAAKTVNQSKADVVLGPTLGFIGDLTRIPSAILRGEAQRPDIKAVFNQLPGQNHFAFRRAFNAMRSGVESVFGIEPLPEKKH